MAYTTTANPSQTNQTQGRGPAQPQAPQAPQAPSVGSVVPAAVGAAAARYAVDSAPSLFSSAGTGAGGFFVNRAGGISEGQQAAINSLDEAATGTTEASAGMSTLGTAVSAAAAIYGTYQLASNWGHMSKKEGIISGATAGAGVGSLVPGVGTVVGAAVGAVVGFVSSFIHTGKHEDQISRDGVRQFMRENGMLVDDRHLQLADLDGNGQPEVFDIGLDGGASPDYAGGRAPYQVNEEHPFSVQAVGWANPIAAILCGGDAKLTSDFTGYFANAAMSNTTDIEGVRANVLQIMKNTGMNRQNSEATLKKLLDEGKIDRMHFDAYMQSIDTLFAGDSRRYVTTPWGQFAEEVSQGKQAAGASDPKAEAKIADPSGRGDFHDQNQATAQELDPAAQEQARVDAYNAQQSAINKSARAEQASYAKAARKADIQSQLANASPGLTIDQANSLQSMGGGSQAAQRVGTDAAQQAIQSAMQRTGQYGGRYYS